VPELATTLVDSLVLMRNDSIFTQEFFSSLVCHSPTLITLLPLIINKSLCDVVGCSEELHKRKKHKKNNIILNS
jgi:hypothetical protein